MTPWGAFIIGVLLSNLWQWAAWVAKNQKATGWNRWLGYWDIGLPHLVMNLTVDALFCVAWWAEWLDDIVALAPGTSGFANVGIPYTPQVGIMLGAGADLFADQIAFVLRKVLGSRLPFLKTAEEPAAAPATTGGDQ